ncbi:MAG: MFS transporter, partial [Rubrimonas sp.]
LAERFGRKPVLLTGLAAYALAAGLCALAPGFETLLIARAVQGLGSAAPRVMVVALTRDCYHGRDMARVMSLTMIFFMAVPVVAPSVGQAILLVAPWRAIFAVLGVHALVVLWIAAARLPETLHPARRRALRPGVLAQGAAMVLGSRQTVGYTLASGAFLGALFGFISSAQQILGELYGLGPLFPLVFAGIAVAIGVSAFVNARLVGRLGMRRLSHGAVMAFTVIAGALAAVAWVQPPPLPLFVGMLAAAMLLVGMVFSNFNALAMEPQAAAAGLASSMIGGFTTLFGAGVGFGIGQAYDGTVLPLTLGYALPSPSAGGCSGARGPASAGGSSPRPASQARG